MFCPFLLHIITFPPTHEMNANEGVLIGSNNDRNYNNETEAHTPTHTSVVYQDDKANLVLVQTDMRTNEHITVELVETDTGPFWLDPTLTDGPAPGVRVPMYMRILQEVFLAETLYWFVCWLSTSIIEFMLDDVSVSLWVAAFTLMLVLGILTLGLYVMLVAKIAERLDGASTGTAPSGAGATAWNNRTTLTYLYPILSMSYVLLCMGSVLTIKSGFIMNLTLIVWLVSLSILVIVTKWNTNITGGVVSGAAVGVSCVVYAVALLLTFDVFTSTVAVVLASQINAGRLLWIFFYAKKMDKYTVDEGRRAHLDLYTEALYNAIVKCYHQRPEDTMVVVAEDEDDTK